MATYFKRDVELYKNKNVYSIEYLKENINDFTLYAILHTQTLTPDFCVEYLLVPDNKYAKDEDDEESEADYRRRLRARNAYR